MSPSNPLFARFPNHSEFCWPWDSRWIPIEWIETEKGFFFRPQGESVRFIWHSYPSSSLSLKQDFDPFSRSINKECLYRYYCLADGDEISLNWKEGVVHTPQKHRGRAFDLPEEFAPYRRSQRCLFAPIEAVEPLLGNLASDPQSDPQSDFAAAREQAKEYANAWTLVVTNQGSRQELKAILEALVVLFANAKAQQRRQNGVSFLLFQREAGNRLTVHYPSSCLDLPKRAFDILNQHFTLTLDTRYRRFNWQGWRHFDETPHFQCTASPSMHEKMEALVTWRNFLKGKVPDAEISQLMPRL